MKPLTRPCVAVALAAAVTVTACTVSSAAAPSPAAPSLAALRPDIAMIRYYLALGDSLSQGVQPDAAGVSIETRQGYPEQAYAVLHRTDAGLRLVTLGCPGETTSTMIGGGICRYTDGSQLASAVAFLRAHRGHVPLVTIDIGGNDPETCGQHDLLKAASCIGSGIPSALANLNTIMAKLRAVAGPGTRVVGINYYLPELAKWRNGLQGHAIAWLAERLAAGYNGMLDRIYRTSGARVADVFTAFRTADFTGRMTIPGIGVVPRNVAAICQWTWECTAPPRGPNQHANNAGYQIIARTVLQAAGPG